MGGILVLFIYVTSLASNEIFTFSIKLLLTSRIIFILTFTVTLIIDNSLLYLKIINEEITRISTQVSIITENSLNLNKLYNYPTNIITIILINYLLITLIAIVKITKLFYGPLRSIN